MKKSILALGLVAGTSIVSLAPVANTSAISLSGSDGNYTITREIENVYLPVNNTFTYKITAKSCDNLKSGTLPLEAAVTFENADPDAAHKATATGTVSLSGLEFEKNGVCTLEIAEIASSNESQYGISENKDTIGITVENNLDSNNVPTGTQKISMASKDIKFTSGSNAVKSFATVSKTVNGGLADPAEQFEFSVTIPAVDAHEASDTYMLISSNTQTSQVTCNYGTACTIKIAHNESFTIGKDASGNSQLVAGADKITVVENGATSYTTTYTDSNLDGTKEGKTIATNRDINEKSEKNILAVVNTYNTTPFTGKFFSILPIVLLGAVTAVSAVVIAKKKSEN